MNRPGFIEGVGVALAGSVLAGVAWTLLTPLLPFATLVRVLITALAGGYLLYLLVRGRLRIGRVSALTAWAVLSIALWLLGASLLVHVLAQACAVWLVRLFAFPGGVFAAMADLLLVGVGLLAAAWTMVHTGSVALAAWCLLLVQAAFPCLPAFGARRTRTDKRRSDIEDPFERAHRAAQTALVRLASHR